MNPTIVVLLLIVGAYLCGAIPFGLLVGRARGVDVRTAGSRNIGATNVGRTLGRKYGVLVFVLDVAKGLGPMILAGHQLVGLANSAGLSEPTRYLCWLAVGAACVLGHNFPVYLRFRGGKGVATTLGVALGAYPVMTYPALLAGGVWLVVVLASRYVSLASVAAAIALPVAFILVSSRQHRNVLGDAWPMLLFAALLATMIVVRHRANLVRLLEGTERKIGRSAGRGKEPAPPTTDS